MFKFDDILMRAIEKYQKGKRSMTFKNFICKGVLVFIALLLIGWLGQYIYMVNGEIDWFRLMLVYGVPVGISHMFIIVPWHWDLSGILGMVALCVIVGGVFGCVIAAGLAVRAIARTQLCRNMTCYSHIGCRMMHIKKCREEIW